MHLGGSRVVSENLKRKAARSVPSLECPALDPSLEWSGLRNGSLDVSISISHISDVSDISDLSHKSNTSDIFHIFLYDFVQEFALPQYLLILADFDWY